MLGRLILGAILAGVVTFAAPAPGSAKDVWLGTAPFCKAKKSDCTSRGMDYVKESKSGDGKKCVSGKKVLCRMPSGYKWVGTAPFCNASKKSCHEQGMVYVRSNKSGDGKSCTSGTKVMCRPWKFGDKQITTWKGTAPACEAQPTSCPSNMLYVKADNKGDGKTCTSGQKVQCRTPTLKMSDKSRWMELAAGKIGSKKLNEIIIPGSHDSGTQPINSKSGISPDKSDWYWEKIPGSLVAAWAKTQVYNVAGQLAHGARSIDVRVCKKGSSYYTCHGKYGESLNTVLRAIKGFKDRYRKEVIFVHITHFYGFSGDEKQDHANVLTAVYNTFGKGNDMLRYTSSLPTYGEVQSGNARLIVQYSKTADYTSNNAKLRSSIRSKIGDLLWPDSKFDGSYGCASDYKGWTKKSKLRDDQAKWIKRQKLSDCTTPGASDFVGVTSQLTPDAGYYAGAIARWKPQNLLQVNMDVSGEIAEWLDDEWKSNNGFKMGIDGYGRTVLHEKIIKMYVK